MNYERWVGRGRGKWEGGSGRVAGEVVVGDRRVGSNLHKITNYVYSVIL